MRSGSAKARTVRAAVTLPKTGYKFTPSTPTSTRTKSAVHAPLPILRIADSAEDTEDAEREERQRDSAPLFPSSFLSALSASTAVSRLVYSPSAGVAA